MAVQDKYVNTLVTADKLANSHAFHGGATRKSILSEEIAAADDDLSVYRYFRVPATWVVVAITCMHDTITSASDYDCGLYIPGVGGAAKDKDVFADGVDISTGARTTDMLQTVNVADIGKQIFEHAGDSESAKLSDYDLALTANTVGSIAGTVTLIAEFVEG